jgi:hypothetical protein
MSNEIITATSEVDNLVNAVQAEARFDRLLKFKKGHYKVSEDDVPLGTEFLVHPAAWLKVWAKFVDKKLVDKKVYCVAKGEKPIHRNEPDALNLAETDKDPWSLQDLLPLENLETGEVVIFTTSTVGGKQCVREVVDAYTKRVRKGRPGQPIIALRVKDMPTKKHGTVPRPFFEVVGWNDAIASSISTEEVATAIPVNKAAANKHDDMDDEIPF